MFKWNKEMRRKNLDNIHLLQPTNKKITNLFKHTNTGIAFRNTNTLQFTKPKTQYQTTEHNKRGVYKQRNTCYTSYIKQAVAQNWDFKNTHHTLNTMNLSQPTPDILNCKNEYRTAPLRTPWRYSNIDKPSLLLPQEQLYIQLFHHNNQLIPEHHSNEQNPMFQLLHNWYHTSQPTWHLNQYLTQHGPTSFIPSCIPVSQLYRYVRQNIDNTLIAFPVALLFIY